MRILLAAMWLLLDAARSWFAWHTRALRRRPRENREHSADREQPENRRRRRRRASTGVRTFANPTVDDWARAAERAAAADLAATRPGTVRRVVVH